MNRSSIMYPVHNVVKYTHGTLDMCKVYTALSQNKPPITNSNFPKSPLGLSGSQVSVKKSEAAAVLGVPNRNLLKVSPDS